VFRQLEQPEVVPDAAGGELGVRRLEPAFAVVGGSVTESIAWRGQSPSET
jgi:hypothetical protein